MSERKSPSVKAVRSPDPAHTAIFAGNVPRATPRALVGVNALRWMLLAAVAVLAVASNVRAQQVRGVVSDATGVPVPGVLMQLMDSASRPVAQTLSGERGVYRLRALVPGVYVVRSLRIGYRPSLSDTLTLTADSEHRYDVSLAGIALNLDTVRVSGRASCRIARDSALQSFHVLDQARGVLIAAGLPDESARWQLTRILFERMYDSSGVRPAHQRHEWWSGAVSEPWKSVPSDVLHTSGYIIAVSDSVTYRAPGLDALSSAEFLDDHCFRLVASVDDEEIGLAFEPTAARRKVAEISGTLWVERRTAQLRRLTFGYVNAPLQSQERNAGGELHFAPIVTGGWVITRWKLRMPVLELRRRTHISVRGASRGAQEVTVAGYREVGGELVSVSTEADTLWRHPPVRIAGRVADSTGHAVPGARITADYPRDLHVADANGRFILERVPPGEVVLEARTDALDSLSTVVRSTATVFESTSDLEVRLPTSSSVLRAMCGASFATGAGRGGSGVALVSLSAPDAPHSLSRAKVTIEWLDSDGTPHWVEVRPDRDGVAHFCGVPVRQTLIVSASADTVGAATTQLRIADDRRVVRTEMMLDPTIEVGAIAAGVVVRDSADVPIPGVEVVFPALAKSQTTSLRGLFRLRDIPAGTHRLVVRKMGYGPVDTTVTLRAGETLERRIVLGRVTALAQVLVTATAVPPDPRMREFEENRRVGLGHFLTRDDLAKFEGMKLGSALAQMPGIRVMYGSAGFAAYVLRPITISLSDGRQWTLEGGGRFTGGCFAQVYLDNVLIFRGDTLSPVPDINRFDPGQIEAVEYYKSAAQTPAKYAGLNSSCGVLVLHTRRPR